MRADQRQSLHRTILTAAVLLLSASAAAAQTTFYGPDGNYLGQGTWRRNTTTVRAARCCHTQAAQSLKAIRYVFRAEAHDAV
jgi:hypothetical protein